MPKAKGKGKKKKKPIDPNLLYCDDQHFDETLAIVRIEHCLRCPIYQEMAQRIFDRICQQFPDTSFKLIRNEFDKMEPREGSFEVSIARNCRVPDHTIWSGLPRGPPRREKFPPLELPSELIERIRSEIKPPSKPKAGLLP
uniref:Uncharacterized protein n=1 Tax=Anopheles albimanus TaxID=7167 RepID=A0A182FQQ5_ANOAL